MGESTCRNEVVPAGGLDGEIIGPDETVELKVGATTLPAAPQPEPAKLFVNMFDLLNEGEDGYFLDWNRKWRAQVGGLKATDEFKVK